MHNMLRLCLAEAEVKMLNALRAPQTAVFCWRNSRNTGLFLGCGMNSVGVATGGAPVWRWRTPSGMARRRRIFMRLTLSGLIHRPAGALTARVPEAANITRSPIPASMAYSAWPLPLRPIIEQDAFFGQVFGFERHYISGDHGPRSQHGRLTGSTMWRPRCAAHGRRSYRTVELRKDRSQRRRRAGLSRAYRTNRMTVLLAVLYTLMLDEHESRVI